MSTDTPQQAARTPTPVPDVIDLTNDSETATTRPPTRLNTRRESVERRLPRSQPSGRRRHDLASHRNQDVRSARDTQTSRGTVIDLEAPNFEDVQAASEPDEPFGVNDDEFLALFQEPPSSPGFEITGERSLRSEPPRRNIAERRPTPYTIEEDQDPPEPPPLPNLLFQNLPHGLASWIARTGTRIGGGDTAGRAERNSGTEGYRAAIRAPYQAAFGQVPGYGGGGGWPVPPHVQIRRHNLVEAFQRPRLNYEAQGFELLGATHSSPPPRSASPYKAPRAAAEGFARKVEEDDIVVCPHCGDELGKGDDDLKQQIWVVKQCGHVRHTRSFFWGNGANIT